MNKNPTIVQPIEANVAPMQTISGGHIILLAVLVVAALFPWFSDSPSHQNVAILVMMAAQMGVAWNIVGGYAGQVSLGHVAFYGLGAYTSTLLFTQFGVNPWIAMLLGGVFAAAISLVIGWSCFRLKGHYFTMATIAVAEIVQIVFTNWEFAGAAVGITIPMDQEGWGAFVFASKVPYYYIALGLLLLTLLANFIIEKSYLGYYFRAIKDEPDAARSLGVSLSKYKQIAFAVSSFFTALGGSFYAQKELYIDPASVLGTAVSIKMALVSILGGIGTLFGPVIGAGVLTIIDEGTRVMFGGSGRGTDLIIYATLIVVIAVYYPTGVMGWIKNLSARRALKSQNAKGV
ncbi:branched-chain amino acid ABC transporter permease [Noviherbaspirillum cavernae]|uniref:Branched-chain amino acid ABC transporter permease n=1 Tax=Noviherbaspirillum cavernae TaxID=2320862 RepID=A0A418WW75_9BURK|nr:branched-chain amino acid ABC transporter permease [Noviherbaspirillum cavernae]RJF96907.1 branched-chain amino acid ABC transporter permease [Noviherbaspirillum cavernae]